MMTQIKWQDVQIIGRSRLIMVGGSELGGGGGAE